MSRPRIHLRYHAARRRAIAGLQHDTFPRSCAWRASWWSWAWISWRPASPSLRKAISKPWTPSAASFPWAQVAALARCCTLDVERAAKSLEHAKRPRIHTFIATSDIHLKYKLKKSRQQVLDEAVAAVELARSYVDDVEFSAEDGARTDPDYLEQISQGGGRRRRAHRQHSGHGGLLDARRIRRADRPHGAGRWAIRPSSACTATTTWAWRSPIPSPRCRRARGRWSAPSTASASARATARSKKSS